MVFDRRKQTLKLLSKSSFSRLCFNLNPQFLAISAGFDAYERDPIGAIGVTIDDFSVIGECIRQTASELKIPFAHFLEGVFNSCSRY